MSIVNELISGIREGDVRSLSRAITIIESRLSTDRTTAMKIIEGCASIHGSAHRIGVTGVPGVGKSTFIEAIGLRLVEEGKKLAVLAIDPTSSRSSGSILGDKTRMESLSSHPQAFIRPSASALTLGGVAQKTRETILLCEAAGYDTILIETVGVGQSETAVRGMVDTFLLLMLAGAGDELQGIKRGIMEMADILLVNKVEEGNKKQARNATSDYRTALHMLGKNDHGWSAQTGMVSALTGYQIEESIQMLKDHLSFLRGSEAFEEQRLNQDLLWFDETVRQSVLDRYFQNEENKERMNAQRHAVENREVSPLVAAQRVLLS